MTAMGDDHQVWRSPRRSVSKNSQPLLDRLEHITCGWRRRAPPWCFRSDVETRKASHGGSTSARKIRQHHRSATEAQPLQISLAVDLVASISFLCMSLIRPAGSRIRGSPFPGIDHRPSHQRRLPDRRKPHVPLMAVATLAQ